MSGDHIFIETLYGFKCVGRNVIFRIFIVLGIVVIALYVFTPLSALPYVKSINQLLKQPSMGWISQALPSSIPFTCAYLYNILQLFFVTVLAINDTRLFHLDAMMALNVHPQGNSDISVGNIFGKFLAFSMANILIFAFCGLLNLLFYPKVFNIGYYLFYWFTLNLPVLVFCLGISTLVTRLTRNQGLNVILLAVILGVLTIPCSIWLNGVLDPLAARIPNMFSDFTGHVYFGSYILQRIFILFFGIGLAILAVIPYPRIHNNERAKFRLACVALFPLLFAGGFAIIYSCGFQSISDEREAFRAVYSKFAQRKVLKIVDNQLYLKETENGGISVTSRMRVENRENEALPLFFYLNPRLVISSIIMDGKTVTFQRDLQVVLVDKELASGEITEVVVNYEGKIDNSFCFLDVSKEKYISPMVNTIDIYRFGYTPAFCQKEYKLLTPECVWYPVSVPPYDTFGFRRSMFTRYRLEVEHDPKLMAISQGEASRDTVGKTTFTLKHGMKGITLCIGNYRKREIVVGSDALTMIQNLKKEMPDIVKDDYPTKVALFYLPEHEFMLDFYDEIPKEKWSSIIEDAKSSIKFYGDNGDYFLKRIMNEVAFDPTLQYPYSWITVVEVPCDFYVFPRRTLQEGERVQEGMVFLPEKKFSEDVSVASYNDKELEIEFRLKREFDQFRKGGSCDLKSTGKGNTSFIYSDECPLINDALFLAFYPYLTWVNKENIQYFVVDYMKNHSLEEALSDTLLSPELFDWIFRMKCAELKTLLEIKIGEQEFHDAYHDFLKRHLFEETTFEDFSQEIFANFNVRLDSIVMNWFRMNQLPVFEIDGHTVFIKGKSDRVYDFRVFNWGKVPGIININTNGKHPGWIIPPGEGRAIRTYGPALNSNVSTYMSLNVPKDIELSSERGEADIDMDTTKWFLPLDSTFFSIKNENEFIVDNVDSGFTILETRKFNIASLFGIVETRAKYYEYPPYNHWGFTVDRNGGYGFPVKGAYFKRAGKGNQKVQWETDLPEGAYEVFCYQPSRKNRGGDVQREYYYSVFDGKKEHEVILLMDKNDGGWISLGVFDFQGRGRVTLSDKDQKHDSIDKHDSPQVIIADAMKWVKVQQ